MRSPPTVEPCCGHHAERAGEVRAALAVGVAVDVDAGEVVLGGAEVDEAQLVLDVRERLQHLAVDERAADAALTAGAVAGLARAVDLGADAERTGGDLRRLGDRPHVHEDPDRHQAERGHRPERDLQPRLRGGHVRRVGLGRRGRRRRRPRPCGRRGPTAEVRRPPGRRHPWSPGSRPEHPLRPRRRPRRHRGPARRVDPSSASAGVRGSRSRAATIRARSATRANTGRAPAPPSVTQPARRP